MSVPPRDYAPVVKDDGVNGARKTTPIRRLQREQGPEPEWVKCPFCKNTTTVRRVSEPSDEAKCLTLCCCALGIFRLFLPSGSKWFENIDIHCTSCDRHLATVPPDGEIQIVRVPDRQLPPLKK
ncbi:hypothetical protein GGS24DRAFT_497648 [Hypoxylon argillaceum]|nr:hypothetical protein GGS24DRAFT_497648 [Hypoxylon argillaceum]